MVIPITMNDDQTNEILLVTAIPKKTVRIIEPSKGIFEEIDKTFMTCYVSMRLVLYF